MTALDRWIWDQTTALLAPDQTASLDQRLGIALVQSRAAECRHLAGELQIKGATQNATIRALVDWLWERSSKLEKYGLELATNWPPDSKPEEPKMIEVAHL